MKKKLLALTLVLMLLLAGCGSAAPAETPAPTPAEETAYLGLDNDIVILYTNDVHCAVDDNLGYTGLATVKNALEAQGKHVVLGDNGDALTEMAASAAMAWCNREDIPEDMEGAVALMVAALAGESGAVKTIKRGDTSVTYDNGSDAKYLAFLNPWRRLGRLKEE